MLKDGLKDANISSVEPNLEDDNDVVGASYLKMENRVSFLDSMIYTVELPVSEHKCRRRNTMARRLVARGFHETVK